MPNSRRGGGDASLALHIRSAFARHCPAFLGQRPVFALSCGMGGCPPVAVWGEGVDVGRMVCIRSGGEGESALDGAVQEGVVEGGIGEEFFRGELPVFAVSLPHGDADGQ